MTPCTILLPSVIRVLGGNPQAAFNLYFSNFLMPFRNEWDVQVWCEYGQNRGDCWCLEGKALAEEKNFPLTLLVYDEWGEKIAERVVTVKVCMAPEASVRTMFFGDSMTHSGSYMQHACDRMPTLQTVGFRTFDGKIYREGRGGWDMFSYFEHRLAKTDRIMSPFVFPIALSGEEYYGDLLFWRETQNPNHHPYAYDGYAYEEPKEGQYALSEGEMVQLRHGTWQKTELQTEFAFDFGKFIVRHNLGKLHAVSVLIGANDLQKIRYEQSSAAIESFVNYLQAFEQSVHAHDPEIAVVFNLPILGGSAYQWGRVYGSAYTEKLYRFNMQHAAQAMLATFDNREDERNFICPMLAAVDPVNAFKRVTYRPNPYADVERETSGDWIHPAKVGHCQMGDAIAAVLADI